MVPWGECDVVGLTEKEGAALRRTREGRRPMKAPLRGAAAQAVPR
jgi:hypothetical protein